MLAIDLRGKRAVVAGVADDGGYGFAIAKALAEDDHHDTTEVADFRQQAEKAGLGLFAEGGTGAK